VASFSEDLRRFKELEERYRRELAEYETEAATYKNHLQMQPNDPELLKRYELVEQKGRQARATYDELEQLRRALLPSAVG
jgi:transketolase N-terminal domain/subunit